MKNNITKLFKKIDDNLFIRLIRIFVFVFGISFSILISKNFIYNIIAILLLSFLLLLNLLIIMKKQSNLVKFKKKIYTNKEEFEKELNNIIFVNYKEYILTENYIIDLNWFKIIKYSDVRFVYRELLLFRDISLALGIKTNKEKTLLIIWSCSTIENFYGDLEKLIISKNPKVIKCKKRNIKKLIKDIV